MCNANNGSQWLVMRLVMVEKKEQKLNNDRDMYQLELVVAGQHWRSVGQNLGGSAGGSSACTSSCSPVQSLVTISALGFMDLT